MAYLSSTVLSDFQALEAQNEKRISKYGMLDLAKASTLAVDYVPPSVQEKMATLSGARNAVLPVLKDQTVTVTTTPGFANIPVNLGESGTYYFTAYDVFSGFRLYPSSFENNQLDAQWYVNNVLRNVLQACAATTDDIIETVLEARKTQALDYVEQISQGDGAFTFDAGAATLEIAKAAVKDTMYTNLNAIMIANKMPGDYNIVTSPAGLSATEVNMMKYGIANDKNLIQFDSIPAGRKFESHQLAPGSDIFNGFFVRDGAIGVYENFPWDFRNGTIFGGKEWQISDVNLPFMNMRANVFINKEATDSTALVGATDTNAIMTHFEEMALWFRFYVVYRYNSAIGTIPNDIVKLSGKTA